jgi:hypothetical protein
MADPATAIRIAQAAIIHLDLAAKDPAFLKANTEPRPLASHAAKPAAIGNAAL